MLDPVPLTASGKITKKWGSFPINLR